MRTSTPPSPRGTIPEAPHAHPPLLVLLLAACGTADPADDGTAGDDTDVTPGGDTDVTPGGDTDGTPGGDTDGTPGGDTDDTDPPAPTWSPSGYALEAASGTRLKAHALVDDHGNEVVMWFDDTDLGVRCTVQRANDGVLRCLPASSPVYFGGYYSDDTCQDQLLSLPTACASSTWVHEYETAGLHLRKLGGAWYPNPYLNNGRTCLGTALPSTVSLPSFSEADLTDFVAFTESGVDVDGTLGRRVLTGTDGSKLTSGMWSVTHAQSARIWSDGSGARAIPYLDVVDGSYLTTATCGSATAAVVLAAETPTPAYIGVNNRFTGATSFQEVTGTADTWCDQGTLRDVEPGRKTYLLGATTPLSSFPSIRIETDTGNGQRFQHLVTAAGASLVPNANTDSLPLWVDGIQLTVVEHESTLKGIPVDTQVTQLASNSSCSHVAIDSGQAGAGVLVTAHVQELGPLCNVVHGAPPRILGLWRTNAGIFGGNVYGWNGSECMSYGIGTVRGLDDANQELVELSFLEL